MKHNLFHYATSELSQDAFLCWLLSYAMEDGEGLDRELSSCAHALLQAFCPGGKELYVVDIERQYPVKNNPQKGKKYPRIDILVTLRDRDGCERKLIIEDKVGTSEHSGQLETYKQILGPNDFPGIYYRSDLLGDVCAAEKAGYSVFTRREILPIFNHYAHIQNVIFQSYYQKLKEDNENAQHYLDYPVSQWDYLQFKAFFHDLIPELGGFEKFSYYYVPHKNKGCLALAPHSNAVTLLECFGIEIYFQVEAFKKYCYIRLKAAIPEGDASNTANMQRFIDECIGASNDSEKYIPGKLHLGIIRPHQVGAYRCVTIGFVEIRSFETLSHEQLSKLIQNAYMDKMPKLAEAFRAREKEVFAESNTAPDTTPRNKERMEYK